MSVIWGTSLPFRAPMGSGALLAVLLNYGFVMWSKWRMRLGFLVFAGLLGYFVGCWAVRGL